MDDPITDSEDYLVVGKNSDSEWLAKCIYNPDYEDVILIGSIVLIADSIGD